MSEKRQATECIAYICHATHDADIAAELVNQLESRGCLCWLGRRDTKPNASYADEIVSAIDNTPNFILLLSNVSNHSKVIHRELERAVGRDKNIIVIRLDKTIPGPEIELFILTLQWLDLDQPLKGAFLDNLCRQMTATHQLPATNSDLKRSLVFISHASEDLALAKQVFEQIQAVNTNVFLAEISLPQSGNAEYMKEIDSALESARHMVVVGNSAENLQKPWVEAEWRMFINEKRSGRKAGNILTIVGHAKTLKELPFSLRYYECLLISDNDIQSKLKKFLN